jgi:hypothetical protein
LAIGPGKYDALATYVREQAQANVAIIIVVGGVLGSGFSVQAFGEDVTLSLPGLLRKIADDIERDMAGKT